MQDVNQPAAESSPAPDSSQVLASMTSEQRSEWRQTGNIPEPTKQASAPADTPKEADSVAAEDAAKPEAEAGKSTQEHRKPGAESRIQQLIAEKKELERKLQAKESAKVDKPVEAKPEVKEEKQPAPDKILSADEYFAQPENSSKTYEDYVDYRSAENFKQLRAKEREETAKAEQEKQKKEQNETIEKSWMSRVDAAIEAHDDFKTVVTKEFNDSIKPGTVLDGWLLDSEQGAEIMYHFAKNPDEYAKLQSLTPFAQARRLTKLEDKLSSAKPAEQAAADSEATEVAPVPKTTKAPKPASEVGGRGTAPDDAAAAAAKNGNYRAFKEEQDRKDLERARRG